MDCFWESQITSKQHIIDLLQQDRYYLNNVYIFGGWYGLLAKLIEDSSNLLVTSIFSIDIDPVCDWVINDVYPNSNIQAVTADMAEWDYPSAHQPDTVINTITEHVTQEVYDEWWSKIPEGTFYLLQGNDFYEEPEHIRCAKDMIEFKEMNRCENSLNEFEFNCTGLSGKQFTRFMVSGFK